MSISAQCNLVVSQLANGQYACLKVSGNLLPNIEGDKKQKNVPYFIISKLNNHIAYDFVVGSKNLGICTARDFEEYKRLEIKSKDVASNILKK